MSGFAGSIESTTLNAELLTGNTGVRITGVDIPKMTDEQVEQVRRLVGDYCVGVFPGAHLKPEEQRDFIGRFGKVTVTPGVNMRTEYDMVHKVADRGDPDHPVSGGFHTDTCFVEKPPSFSSLNAMEVPKHGGDTMFCNQYMAYDSLSDVMKGWLKGPAPEARRKRHGPAGGLSRSGLASGGPHAPGHRSQGAVRDVRATAASRRRG